MSLQEQIAGVVINAVRDVIARHLEPETTQVLLLSLMSSSVWAALAMRMPLDDYLELAKGVYESGSRMAASNRS